MADLNNKDIYDNEDEVVEDVTAETEDIEELEEDSEDLLSETEEIEESSEDLLSDTDGYEDMEETSEDLLGETDGYEEIEETQDIIDNTQIFDGTSSDIEAEAEMTEEVLEEEEPTGGRPGPKRDNRKILIPIIIAAIIILLVLIFVMLNSRNTDTTPSASSSATPTTTSEVDSSIDFSIYNDLWDARYAINSDYIGEIVFESGIIDLPVVQYIDNSNLNNGYIYYLRTDWETMTYDEEGSIFVDPYSDIDSSMNIVIYGHYVYASYDPSMTHMFTPLALLLDEENYEENSIFYLVLEDEVRVYQIAHVYLAQLYSSTGTTTYDMLDEGMYYMNPEWTEEELAYYLEQVSLIEQYDTGVEIEYGDKFITLQTCVENRDDQREIVIAKQIGSFSYRDTDTDTDTDSETTE